MALHGSALYGCSMQPPAKVSLTGGPTVDTSTHRIRSTTTRTSIACLVLSIAAGLIGSSACNRSRTAKPSASVEPSAASPPLDGTEETFVLHGAPFRIRLFALDLSKIRLSVEDAGMRRELPNLDSDSSIRFASNGGFFEPNGRPRGLVVSDSKELSPFDRSLSGGVLAVDNGVGRLYETESWRRASAHHAWAVQCRPRLVVGGVVNIRSDDGQRAERTTLCLRKAGHEVVAGLMTSERGGPSLLAAAEVLLQAGCDEALNIDGGPSSAMAWRDAVGSHSLPPRGPIRHAIVARDQP